MNEYTFITMISAFFFGKIVWGWWLKFVFNHAGLRIHPTKHVPIIEERIDQLMVVVLARMRPWHTALSLGFAYLVSEEAVSVFTAIASGLGAALMMILPFVMWFLQAAQVGHKDLFVYLVKAFGKDAFPKQ